MRNKLENKAGLLKSIKAKYNDAVGLRTSSRTGTGTGKLVVQPLLSVRSPPDSEICLFHSWGQKYAQLMAVGCF